MEKPKNFVNIRKISKAELIEVLKHIIVAELIYDEWIHVGKAMYNCGFTLEEWMQFSMNDSRYEEKRAIVAWNSFAKNNRFSAETLLYIAKERFGFVPERNYQNWQDAILKPFKKKYGDDVRIAAIYDYYDEHGNYLYSNIRIEGSKIKGGKTFVVYVIDEINDRYYLPANVQRVPYNLPELIQARKKGFVVVIVEGEKACERAKKALRGKPFVVITFGSCTGYKKEYCDYLKGADVIALPDNDEDGQNMAKKLLTDLKTIAHSVRCITISKLQKGDIYDYFEKENGTTDELLKIFNDAVPKYAPWIYFKKDDEKTNPALLVDCFSQNEHYIDYRDKDEKEIVWFYTENNVYSIINKNDLKASFSQYIPQQNLSDMTLNNAVSLLMARNDNHVVREPVECNDEYLNFPKGLLKKNDAENKLLPHTPEIITTFQFGFNYEPEKTLQSDCPVFTKFIKDLARDESGNIDREKIDVLQEIGGILICSTKVYLTKKAFILISEEGNSGKSVFVRLIEKIIGENKVVSVNLSEMNPQQRFVLGKLYDARIITCGDESGTTIKDSSIFKRITGGDQVKVEAKGQQQGYIVFGGGILIAANELPFFQDDQGSHIFERLLVVPCDHHIPVEERDANILEKMAGEYPAIFNFFYAGYKRVVENGYKFSHCTASEKAAMKYQCKSDSLFRFVNELCEITRNPEDKISRTEFDTRYNEWSAHEGLKYVGKSGIRDRLESLGVRVIKARFENDNRQVYTGIRYTEE